jgi:hypothetical protein
MQSNVFCFNFTISKELYPQLFVHNIKIMIKRYKINKNKALICILNFLTYLKKKSFCFLIDIQLSPDMLRFDLTYQIG